MKRWLVQISLVMLLFVGCYFFVGQVSSPDFSGPFVLTQSRRPNQVRRWLGGRNERPTRAARVGKNHELVRSVFRDVIEDANKSTARVYVNDRQVAMGTVVAKDGYIITKASELRESKSRLQCKLPGRQRVDAKVISKDKELDIALLKANVSDVTPIVFADLGTATEMGSWVAVPGGYGDRPVVVGTISARTRRIPQDRAILGVELGYSPNGVLVAGVKRGSGAESVGIQKDDVIIRFNDYVIRDSSSLIFQVGLLLPGQQAKVVVQRDSEELEFNPRMGRHLDLLYAEQGLEAHEGGPLSQRRSGFRRVIQHDCLIGPNQCGGPLVNLDGEAIGINIARAGRVTTYAVSYDVVKSRIDFMLHSARNSAN
ncbi:MAG: trypsin-like peptidase domain-containing protein [Planctomycetota bacterium]